MEPSVAVDQMPLPAPRRDGVVLHFLKELPGVVWVFIMLIFFTVVYLYYKDDFIPRIIDALIGAFLGLVVGQRARVQAPMQPAQMDNVEVRAVNPNSDKNQE